MPSIMLDEDTSETLQRPEHGAVDHHRQRLLPVGPDIEGAKPPRQIEIDLDRTALPVASDGVAQHIFELGPVKGALPRIELVGESRRLYRPLERCLSLVPYGISADTLVGFVGKFDAHIGKAEVAID